MYDLRLVSPYLVFDYFFPSQERFQESFKYSTIVCEFRVRRAGLQNRVCIERHHQIVIEHSMSATNSLPMRRCRRKPRQPSPRRRLRRRTARSTKRFRAKMYRCVPYACASFREASAATRAGRRRGTTTTCVRVARTLVFFVFCCLHKRANHFLSFYAFVQQGVVSGVILRGGDSTIVERAGLPCFPRVSSTATAVERCRA